jgi:hypothetical protein
VATSTNNAKEVARDARPRLQNPMLDLFQVDEIRRLHASILSDLRRLVKDGFPSGVTFNFVNDQNMLHADAC